MKKHTRTESPFVTQETGSVFPFTGIFSPGGFLARISVDLEEGDPNEGQGQGQFLDQQQQNGNQLVISKQHIPSNPCFRLQVASAGAGAGASDPQKGPFATEKVFGIDHILEKIIEQLDTVELLKSRRVCHRWNSIATVQLEKQVVLEFCDYVKTENSWNKTKHLSLSDLTQFQNSLQNPNSQGYLFPWTNFKFYFSDKNTGKNVNILGNLTHPVFTEFLNELGPSIKELSLKWSFGAVYADELHMMKAVQTILVGNVHNISVLSINVPFKVEWKIDSDSRDDCCALRRSDPEFSEIHQKLPTSASLKGGISRAVFTNLKILKLGMWTSAKLLEVIILLAPNLKEVTLPESYAHFLAEPMNRLHLLKELTVVGCSVVRIERLETISLGSLTCSQGQGNLELRHLHLDLRYCNGQWNTSIENRVVKIINRMLECSQNSLETLQWKGVAILPGLTWPKVMPNVVTIELRNRKNLFGGSLFPRGGFNLGDTFPKLRYVILQYKFEYANFIHLLKSLENAGPHLTVQTVKIVNSRIRVEKDRVILGEHLELLHKLFPIATVTQETYSEC